jgi:hypothetical protein
MLSFLSCQMHTLQNMYINIHTSNLDIFNIIRHKISPTSDSLTPLLLSQYGYTTLLPYNISGEITVAVIFIIITIFLKIGGIASKSEKIRLINTKIRPLWNVFFVAILPRIATFTGFHIRMIQDTTSTSITNGIFCTIFCIAFIFFFIQLIVHIRRINSKP